MTFRAGGLISGLDTNTIIEQLVALDRQPIVKLQARRDTLNQQKTVIGNIELALEEFRNTIEKYRKSSFLSFRAESSVESVLSAKASVGASEGIYSIEVTQLARAEQNRSTAFSAASNAIKAGTLTIQVQGQGAVKINITEGDTLTDVAYKINSSGARVRATTLDTGSGVFLNLYSLDTGHEIGSSPSDAVVIHEFYNGNSGGELRFTEVQTAQNAIFSLDGLSIERRSNTVIDVINGLELMLTGTGSSTVTVSADLDVTKANIKIFVDTYNKAASLLNTQLTYIEGQKVPVLFGDASLRNLFGRLQSALVEAVEGTGSRLTTLRSLGLKLTAGGQLTFDEQDFNTVVANDFSGIDKIFSADGGVFDRLQAIIRDYSDSTESIFRQKKEGINRMDKNLSDQIQRLETRLDAYEQHLIAQFTYLEAVLAQLKSQQSSLGSIYSLLS